MHFTDSKLDCAIYHDVQITLCFTWPANCEPLSWVLNKVALSYLTLSHFAFSFQSLFIYNVTKQQ